MPLYDGRLVLAAAAADREAGSCCLALARARRHLGNAARQPVAACLLLDHRAGALERHLVLHDGHISSLLLRPVLRLDICWKMKP